MIFKDKVESLDELVFNNRNKGYGAYFLRQLYAKNVAKSLSIAIAVLVLSVAIPYIIHKTKGKEETIITQVTANLMDIKEQEKPKEEITPPPPPPPAEAVIAKISYSGYEASEEAKDNDTLPPPKALSQSSTDTTRGLGTDIGPALPADDGNGDKPLAWAEEMPKFPGGDKALYKYLQENIRYPDIARENNISGKVYVTFVVAKDGSLDKITVVRSADPSLDKEAIRVVKLMPKWEPGKNNGRATPVQIGVPINFTLQ